MEYTRNAPDKRPADAPVYHVKSGREPRLFVSGFHGWDRYYHLFFIFFFISFLIFLSPLLLCVHGIDATILVNITYIRTRWCLPRSYFSSSPLPQLIFLYSTATILDINESTHIPLVEDMLRQYSRSYTLEELLTKPKELDQTNLGNLQFYNFILFYLNYFIFIRKSWVRFPVADNFFFLENQIFVFIDYTFIQVTNDLSEYYLTDEDFLKHFTMSKEEYRVMPGWKREIQKKKVGLY